MSDIEDEPPPVLLPCAICSRTFRPEVLERHVKVCEKTASKKRRVFDSFKNRVSGTELEEFLGPAPLPGQVQKRPVKSPVKKKPPSKWKETHENLIAVLRAARGVEPPPDTVAEFPKHGGNEQCPSCNRFFGPRAFDRHVEFCKEKTARIKMTPSKVSQAQERLEARTKYRAPLSIKPKLTTKEKYSPMLPRKESTESCTVTSSTKSSPPIPTLNKKPVKQTSNFSRQSPIRNSERQRSVSPTKKSLVSNSKSSLRNETQAKHSNQPKIKDRLKSPEELRPKTGSKLTTQEKIRNTNNKIEDEMFIRLRKHDLKREKPSDDESTGTVESEDKQKCKWSSAESISRPITKPRKNRVVEDKTEKPPRARDSKMGKNNKTQNPQINDLSVNDKSFGIFVAACSTRPPSNSKSRKESPEKLKFTPKKEKTPRRTGKIVNTNPEVMRIATPSRIPEIKKFGVSKIPKAKTKFPKVQPEQVLEFVPEFVPEVQTSIEIPAEEPKIVEKKDEASAAIKKKAKKWKNIADISTEELALMTDDFELPADTSQELSESAIWELAAEQFLKSEESTQSISVLSADSLNEKPSIVPVSNNRGGDDFIVLHVADPSKLIENDAAMKLSLSEPCFPSGETATEKHYADKSNEKKTELQKLDVTVFTAFPNSIQPKVVRRKRKKQKKRKKFKPPKLPHIREKTFLANDIPKAKRRKVGEPSIDLIENLFQKCSTEDSDKNKKEFIETLKRQKEKIQKWQITATSHIKFMENFEKSIEDDLKELKNLSRGKKTRRKSFLKELKKEKQKEVKPVEQVREEKGAEPKEKKFEYFEIAFEEPKISPKKKFESFEIPITVIESKKEKNEKERSKVDNIEKEKAKSAEEGQTKIEPVQMSINQNSSLENIEEVDEDEEPRIEIEDFIIAKPNTQKILSKDENCLDQLFPKLTKIDVTPVESATAVPLSYTADSVVDLKSKEKKIKPLKNRMLQKRVSKLPQISVKDSEKKENSMLSLLELWQNKKGSSEPEKVYKTKATLPTVKLAPLSNKNSFQIAVLPFVLKRKLSEILNDRIDKNGSNDSYDPFKQAERQMLALLSWPSTADIKSTKDLSPKPKTPTQQNANLETSPTSAFTKYPKEDKSVKNNKTGSSGKKNPNETFEVNETAKRNSRNEKPAYSAADDWEEIFEKHFDLNRNEMTEQISRTVKSALDGLVKNSLKNNSNKSEHSPKNKDDLTDESIITDVLYTSTPKQTSKSAKSPRPRSKDNTIDLDRTQNTYRKNTNFTYGRITPPEDFNDTYDKGKRDDKPNRNSGISLSSLSFCSQISDTTLADEEVMRSNLEIIGKAAAAAAARTPRRKYARSQSVFDERNKMLFAKTFDPDCTTSDDNDVEVLPKIIDKPVKKSPSRNPYPKSVPSNFSRSQSVMEDRCRGDGLHSDDGDHISSPESNRNRKAKLSGDSAYSSLNRRSPRKNILQNQLEDRLSSSGSEHSLLAANSDFDGKSKSSDKTASKKDTPVKMSKFCHECGSKYPLAIAKFCCECGVRRLII